VQIHDLFGRSRLNSREALHGHQELPVRLRVVSRPTCAISVAIAAKTPAVAVSPGGVPQPGPIEFGPLVAAAVGTIGIGRVLLLEPLMPALLKGKRTTGYDQWKNKSGNAPKRSHEIDPSESSSLTDWNP